MLNSIHTYVVGYVYCVWLQLFIFTKPNALRLNVCVADRFPVRSAEPNVFCVLHWYLIVWCFWPKVNKLLNFILYFQLLMTFVRRCHFFDILHAHISTFCIRYGFKYIMYDLQFLIRLLFRFQMWMRSTSTHTEPKLIDERHSRKLVRNVKTIFWERDDFRVIKINCIFIVYCNAHMGHATHKHREGSVGGVFVLFYVFCIFCCLLLGNDFVLLRFWIVSIAAMLTLHLRSNSYAQKHSRYNSWANKTHKHEKK